MEKQIRRIVLMGIGDVLMGDLGAGCVILEKTAQRVTGSDIDYAWLGDDVRFAPEYIIGSDLCVVAGALDLCGRPGTLHIWDKTTFDRHTDWMAKTFPVIRNLIVGINMAEMVQETMPHFVFIWIDPHIIQGYGLSSMVDEAVTRAVWQIHREIWNARTGRDPLKNCCLNEMYCTGPLPQNIRKIK